MTPDELLAKRARVAAGCAWRGVPDVEDQEPEVRRILRACASRIEGFSKREPPGDQMRRDRREALGLAAKALEGTAEGFLLSGVEDELYDLELALRETRERLELAERRRARMTEAIAATEVGRLADELDEENLASAAAVARRAAARMVQDDELRGRMMMQLGRDNDRCAAAMAAIGIPLARLPGESVREGLGAELRAMLPANGEPDWPALAEHFFLLGARNAAFAATRKLREEGAAASAENEALGRFKEAALDVLRRAAGRPPLGGEDWRASAEALLDGRWDPITGYESGPRGPHRHDFSTHPQCPNCLNTGWVAGRPDGEPCPSCPAGDARKAPGPAGA